MELSLSNIQHFIQSYINIISILLKADVTVVDRNLIRIAGTSLYSRQIGKRINHAEFYRTVLSSGEPNIMIKGSTQYSSCRHCSLFNNCTELADIAYPIFYMNDVIGVISIIAFTEESQNSLMSNNESYMDFLKYMSSLLESKLESKLLNKTNKKNFIQLKSANLLSLENIPSVIQPKTMFITADRRILNTLNIIEQTANSDSTVLITGESGTGKEVLAKVIHQSSNRNGQPMISVNCAAIPESLIESELFGYERGSFTGANKEGQPGKFELADGGVLFLDEIGEMPLSAQTRLLRVLQDKTVQRIGGKRDLQVDVKIVCATNQDLLQLIAEKKFRSDLYYRINVIPFHLPALRERRNDINLLTEEFLTFFNNKFNKNIKLSNDAIKRLKSYDWPGNVRELRNIIEYLANIKESGTIRADSLPLYITKAANDIEINRSLKSTFKEKENQLLYSLASKAHSTEEKKRLADQLGISVSSLYRKVAEYKSAQDNC